MHGVTNTHCVEFQEQLGEGNTLFSSSLRSHHLPFAGSTDGSVPGLQLHYLPSCSLQHSSSSPVRTSNVVIHLTIVVIKREVFLLRDVGSSIVCTPELFRWLFDGNLHRAHDPNTMTLAFRRHLRALGDTEGDLVERFGRVLWHSHTPSQHHNHLKYRRYLYDIALAIVKGIV